MVVKVSIVIILFALTFYKFNKIPRLAIENFDWWISYDERNQIVEKVKKGRLEPNTKMNNGICRLPFDFPIVSDGGNDIWINKDENGLTVKFWISRGFFEAPQTYFIYTNDNESRRYYNELIKKKPGKNWKLEENWYRIMERE